MTPILKAVLVIILVYYNFIIFLRVLIQDNNLLTVCITLINVYYLISQTIMEKMLNMKHGFLNSFDN